MPPLYFWIGWREWSFSVDFGEGQWADLLMKSHFSVIKETLKSPYSGLSGGPGDMVRVFLILMIFFFFRVCCSQHIWFESQPQTRCQGHRGK